jgi:hypothetical protein
MAAPVGPPLRGADKKGMISVGKYAALAILSEDFFTVPESIIPDIESALTVAGGRIVYASAAYEGQDEVLPEITVGWSPVAHVGGYQATPSGVRQAESFLDAAEDSGTQNSWREARGEHVGENIDHDYC